MVGGEVAIITLVQKQLDNIRNLTQGREEAERYYRDIDNQIDDANERNNDGFGGQ